MLDSLPSTELKKMLQFLDSILVPPHAFRRQVLVSMAEIFGYHQSNFWLVDPVGNVVEPVSLGVNKSSIQSYLDYYYHKDYLHPRNLDLELIRANTVIDFTDVLPVKRLRESEFFQDFLSRFGWTRETGVYLLDGERIIGGLCLLRTENEREFNVLDRWQLKLIAKHLSYALAGMLLLKHQQESSLELSYPADISVGLIIFDEYLEVSYANVAAYELCREFRRIDGPDGGPRQFIRILLDGPSSLWQYGMKTTIISPSFSHYTLHLVPDSQMTSNADRQYFSLYMYPKSGGRQKESVALDLTSREQEIVRLVMRGMTNKEIAQTLFISLPTVKSHLQSAFKKLKVDNRAGLCYKLRNASMFQ